MSQRYCSTRCADRQRDRRRRNARRPADTPASVDSNAEAARLAIELEAAKRQLETTSKACQQRLDELQSKLRSQASEIDRLEADSSEQLERISLLHSEVARLKRAQRTNVQDLAHVAAWLVSVAQAKGVALDVKTLDILRRRGWTPSRRNSGAPRA
ncbi:hypothetical protein [Arthrobacter sp. M4]|uniref:hypothetical protein n=1 Tax=Arthrobacter sp. M4 TaxID=218160 RepID=UPI001CDD6D0E